MMMTRMGSMGTEALSRRERFSSGLTNVMRDHKLASSSSANRRDKLLGLSAMGSPAPTSHDFSDMNDLKEDDIWGSDLRPLPEEGYLEEFTEGTDHHKFLATGRRWLGLDKDSYGDRGLSSISASRTIPQSSSGLFDAGMPIVHQSAPMNVPDWSKILGSDKKDMKRNSLDFDTNEDDQEKLPPHELVAREYARSQMTFSVYEGAGRTLKGRDLSRVREAVWKQTGFV